MPRVLASMTMATLLAFGAGAFAQAATAVPADPAAAAVAAPGENDGAIAPVTAERLAAIERNMRGDEVLAQLGKPTRVHSGLTYKNLVPFYSGRDRMRVYWSYRGVGVVVFTRDSYAGTLFVIETRADTSAQ